MICPVHEGPAKFKAQAEVSLRQSLTIDHAGALAKVAGERSQPRMLFGAPEAPSDQGSAMRADVYGDGLLGNERRLVEH